ncbi:MAG: hypothetical protein HKP51_04870 [Sulfitobacter sp.]|nr:hypothetical protein [Sulfitobacter sp.]
MHPKKICFFPSQAGIMLIRSPTPTVSDEKHKSATNRAVELEWWINVLRGDFQPLKRGFGNENKEALFEWQVNAQEMDTA